MKYGIFILALSVCFSFSLDAQARRANKRNLKFNKLPGGLNMSAKNCRKVCSPDGVDRFDGITCICKKSSSSVRQSRKSGSIGVKSSSGR